MKKYLHGGYRQPSAAACILLLISILTVPSSAFAQPVLFDFDSAPAHSPFPLSLTAGGIIAHFSATGQSFSIQEANVLGFTPQGFSGNVIYPNSVFLADLLISFDQVLTGFSIMYACQELGCDDAATMRVTAYRNGSSAGTNTKTAANPGTWPVDVLSCSFPQGFDSVVVHYDSRPPTCQDYGVIFMADNMQLTPQSTSAISEQEIFIKGLIISSPVSQNATLAFSLSQAENIRITVYDLTGRLVNNLFSGDLSAGEHRIIWDVNDAAVTAGVYLLTLNDRSFSQSRRLVILK